MAEASTTQMTTLVAVAGVLGTLLGATVSPVVNYLTNEKQLDVKMLEIELGILREPPKEDAQAMRAWAIELIEKSSGRPFNEQQRNLLLHKQLALKSPENVVNFPLSPAQTAAFLSEAKKTIEEAQKRSEAQILPGMSEGLLFLKPCPLSRDTPCTDWDVNEGKPNGRDEDLPPRVEHRFAPQPRQGPNTQPVLEDGLTLFRAGDSDRHV